MQRRKLIKGIGFLSVSGIVAPAASLAGTPLGSGNVLQELNKKRLLRDIRSKYNFGSELVLTDVNKRAGQLFISVRNRKIRFELRSPDYGVRWYSV